MFIRLKPILKPTIWGGRCLGAAKGKNTVSPDTRIGESWEMSSLPGCDTEVGSGEYKGMSLTDLCREYGTGLLGTKGAMMADSAFPLILKFIDAEGDLSVQVHPDDRTAKLHGYPNGKTEMWYVVDALPGARLYAGFNRPVSKSEYTEAVAHDRIMELLASYEVKAGDVFFLPAGTVHSIGAGIFLAEIQQRSDVTYRIYDYNRLDAQGKPRELHTEKALESIKFDGPGAEVIPDTCHEYGVRNIAECEYFEVRELRLEAEGEVKMEYPRGMSFTAIVCVKGEAEVSDGSGESKEKLEEMQSLLVGADENVLKINSEKGAVLLLARVP